MVADRSWFSWGKDEPKSCNALPVGKPGSLNKLTFVMTGCMDSLKRDDMKKLIEKYGGRVTGAVSGKTSYLISGVDEFGEVLKRFKYKKAEGMHSCKIIDENDLFKLIQPDYDPDDAISEAPAEENKRAARGQEGKSRKRKVRTWSLKHLSEASVMPFVSLSWLSAVRHKH